MTARAEQSPDGGGPRTFASFSEVRNAVLDAMAGATRRIWLNTDYLTDGEIVSALYVAQYRKLDVMVLLGRGKANGYMSRLNYLKNQNIPVYLKPDSFKTSKPTALLCDDRLYYLDGELDFMAKVKKYTFDQPGAEEKERFIVAFAGAANLKVPAVARAVPLVGRANPQNVRSSAGAAAAAGGRYLPQPVPTYSKTDASGAYTYDRRRDPRPDGVPANLPKSLKWQNKPKPVKADAPKPKPAPEGAGAEAPPPAEVEENQVSPDLDLPAEGG